jgi:hypothetical protein
VNGTAPEYETFCRTGSAGGVGLLRRSVVTRAAEWSLPSPFIRHPASTPDAAHNFHRIGSRAG